MYSVPDGYFVVQDFYFFDERVNQLLTEEKIFDIALGESLHEELCLVNSQYRVFCAFLDDFPLHVLYLGFNLVQFFKQGVHGLTRFDGGQNITGFGLRLLQSAFKRGQCAVVLALLFAQLHDFIGYIVYAFRCQKFKGLFSNKIF